MKYVGLLKGVNVGGNNKVNMETLRAVCENIGFTNVKTYINSGNIIFDSSESTNDNLAKKISDAIEREFSLNIRVVVRSMDEINSIIAKNPFAGKFEEEKNMHILFLNEPVPAEKAELLISQNTESEQYAVIDYEIYCLLNEGFLSSLLGKNYIDKKLKIPSTARNWRTVNKIAGM